MIKVEQARKCRQLTTVKLERQEIINSGVTTMDILLWDRNLLIGGGVTTMDRTVVGQENSNRGETTVLAGLLCGSLSCIHFAPKLKD